MKSNTYILNRGGSRTWFRNFTLVIALTVGAMLNSALAQRISGSGGTYTIDNTGTNTGTNFTSFTDAINDLNTAATFTGNVTINVTAGQTFTENAPVITATGNSSASITFIKSGVGANPLITSSGTTSFQGDAAITINGGDYFTFNGINITASDSSLEFGYLVRKASFDNAAQHNTITNCTVLMSRLKNFSYAVLQSTDSIITNSVTAFNTANNALAQTNNNNTYTNITVGNAFNAIWVKGLSTTYRDSNNVCNYNIIGRTGVSNDLGATTGTVACYAIYASNQFTFQGNNNLVRNIVSTGNIYSIYTIGSVNVQHNNNELTAMDITTNSYYYIYGIYLNSVTNAEVNNNNIHDFVATGNPYNYVYGIYVGTVTTATVNNNTVTNILAYYVYGYYTNSCNTVTVSNNSISNTTANGGSYCYYMGTSTNCRLTTNTASNANITGALYLFYMSGGTTDTIDNNTATNMVSTGTIYSLYTGTTTSFRIYNNTIQNITSTAAGIYGLYITTPNNSNIYNNTLKNLKSGAAGSTSYASYFSSINGTCNIYNNTISDFGNTPTATSGTGTIYGAYFSNATTGTVTINYYNNVINGLTKRFTGGATATRYLTGLYFASTSGSATCNYYIVHNSVSIDGNLSLPSSSQVVFTASGNSTSTPILTFRNNVFANLTGTQSGAAKHYLFYTNAAGIMGRAGSSSNYNNWYLDNVNNGFFGYSGGDKTDLAAWVATTGFTTEEANSITGNPLFNSSTNSRLLFGSPAINTGSYISGFDSDITGAARSLSTPSMGAYEIPLDETKPAIVYSPAISVYSTANYVLTNFATITDGVIGAIPTDPGIAPRLYYKTTTNADAFVGNTSSNNGWKYVEASNTTSPFSFTIDFSLLLGGTATTGDTIQYFVVASDTALVANVSSNPSIGFVGTGVGAITTAPTTPNYFVIYGTPAVYTSADVEQSNTSKVGQGTSNNLIIRVKVTTAATGSPAYVSQLDFSTIGGGDDSANIAQAKVYYTGNSSTFSTSNLFGTTVFSPLVAGPIGAFSVTGNTLCPNGDNYFWLVYDMRNTAILGDSIDAELTSVTYYGTPYTYSGGATAGNRKIRANYCASGATNIGDEEIWNVTLGTLNNSSNCNTVAPGPGSVLKLYSNYTTLPATNILRGASLPFSITGASCGNSYNSRMALYFDWNSDGDFADANELAYSSVAAYAVIAGYNFTGNVVVPCDAELGETQMRVIYIESATLPANACGTFGYGETEDYIVNIQDNPISYVSSTTMQNTGVVAPGTMDAEILRIPVKAAGCGVGTLTEMYFNTTGTTSTSDIVSAKLYKTGNSTLFSNTNLIGTVVSPSGSFAFTGLTDTLLQGTNDTNNYWLAFDIASGATTTNAIDAGLDSITAIGGYHIPTASNPAGSRTVEAAMTYISSNTTQSLLTKVSTGSSDNHIIGLEIVTSVSGAPINLSSLDLSTMGTDSLPDITDIKIWYTGNSSTFATSNQFGTTITSAAATQTVTGVQALANGTNYFWVTYSILSDATLGHYVDAELSNVIIGGVTQTPTTVAPTGSRQIKQAYCATTVTYNGYCTKEVQFNTLNVNSGTVCAALPSGYVLFPDTGIATTTVSKGTVYNLSWAPVGTYEGAKVWFDWNDDGIFSPSEFTQITLNNAAIMTPVIIPITVPCDAITGKVRMRVRTNYYGYAIDACGTALYGETEDYNITVVDNPIAYVSSSVIQTSTIVAPNTSNAPILRIPVKASGCGVGELSEMYFNTAGTTASADIIAAKLYATGNSNTFNTNTLLGTVFSPSGAFSFTGLVDTLLSATNDTNNYWLAFDLASGATVNNFVDARVDSIKAVGVYAIPTDNDPTGNRQIIAPMTLISTAATQGVWGKVETGSTHNRVVGLEIVTSSMGSPVDITSLDINTTGTDSLPDIANLKVWYTGNSSTFVTTTQFGTTIAAPAATNTVSGLLSLNTDTNYFWVTYDIASAATIGHYIDGEVTSATIAGIAQIPTVTAPVGARQIRSPYCSSIPTQPGDEEIFSVTVNGATNAYGCTTVAPGPGSLLNRYSNFTTLPSLTTISRGNSISFSIQEDECDGATYYQNGSAIFIDYNQDGDFIDAGEKVAFDPGATIYSPRTIANSFIVPCDAQLGETRMRIIVAEGQTGSNITPCLSYGYGETEDYTITISDNPVAYVSSTSTQDSGVVAPGTTDARIIGVQVVATGCGVGTVTDFYFNTTGTTATADITAAKLYSTGTSSTFNTTKQLGSTISSPSGSFVFSGIIDTLYTGTGQVNYYWLAFDISSSATITNVIDAQLDSIYGVNAYRIPTISSPSGSRAVDVAMLYTSSTAIQGNVSKVEKGSTHNNILHYEVLTSATGSPINVTSMDLSTNGTTSLSDITNLKVWYTGTSSTFATTTQFGVTVASPAATQTIAGTQPLANGTNHFWVTYDIPAGATTDNYVDAELTSVTIGLTPVIPSVTAPTGARQIRNAYCTTAPYYSTYEDIGQVQLLQNGTPVMTNASAGCSPSMSNAASTAQYTNFSTMTPASIAQGASLDFNVCAVTQSTFWNNCYLTIFIDYNQNGTWEANEQVYISTTTTTTSPTFTGNFVIPTTALTGETRMRVVLQSYNVPTLGSACFNVSTAYYYGETEDYTINITVAPPPTTYTWNVVGSGAFTTDSNWTPARTQPLGNDILLVNGGGTTTMTAVPNQSIKSLFVSNSTNVTLSGTSNFITSDTLGIETGSMINAGTVTMITGTDTVNIGKVVGSGKMTGKLKRWMNSTTTSYNFPIAAGTDSRSVNLTYTTPPTTAGSITMQYDPGAPGAGGLPISDVSLTLTLENISLAGVWNITNSDGLVGGTFEGVFNADQIAGVSIVDQTAIVYRSNTFGSWTSPGTATVTTGTASALVLNRAGMTAYGQFGIAGTSSNPLPVKLTTFNALAKAKDAVLNFTTASETNNRGFNIERSLDGRSFESVGFVKGAGNSNRTLNYTYTDLAAFTQSGVWYYRLKQVDFDGKYTYSQIVKVSVNTTAVSSASVHPNPFKSDYTVSFSSTKQGVAQLDLMDMQGRMVTTTQVDVTAGLNTLPVTETATLKSGIYFLKVTLNGESQTLKLVKE